MAGLEVIGTTVGPVAENSYLVFKEETGKALCSTPATRPTG